MFAGTLLPVGILQVLDNIEFDFWHARSNSFWEQDIIQTLGNTRIIPDSMIILGSLALLVFMLKVMTKLKPVEISSREDFS